MSPCTLVPRAPTQHCWMRKLIPLRIAAYAGSECRRPDWRCPGAQWAGSCWYYLRYIDPRNAGALVDREAERYWMPVDLYVGGAEHAVLHLLYARFWHKVQSGCGMYHVASPWSNLSMTSKQCELQTFFNDQYFTSHTSRKGVHA